MYYKIKIFLKFLPYPYNMLSNIRWIKNDHEFHCFKHMRKAGIVYYWRTGKYCWGKAFLFYCNRMYDLYLEKKPFKSMYHGCKIATFSGCTLSQSCLWLFLSLCVHDLLVSWRRYSYLLFWQATSINQHVFL